MRVSETKEAIASEWRNNGKPYEAERTIIYPPNISLIFFLKQGTAKLSFQMDCALRRP